MIGYVINLSAWVLFIEVPTTLVYWAALALVRVARAGLKLQLALMPNDPRGNNG
jgi:hypothetical protein